MFFQFSSLYFASLRKGRDKGYNDAHMNLGEQTKAFLVLGIAIVATGLILSCTLYGIRAMEHNVITATGSAKEKVKSDTVKWTGEIVRRAPNGALASGYIQLERDLEALRAFLKGKGVDPSMLEARPVFSQEEVYYGSDGPRSLGTTMLRQTVVLSATDVEGMTKIASDLKDLIGKGVPVTTLSLEYLYSKLPELRVRLLGGAVKDAKARAGEIAGAGGQSVGDLQSASSGVVQVMAPNSVDVSDYGSYDTSSVDKEVMVTVRATFGLR
jgi:uncharacterized protein